jgi:hypothetical protein
MNSTIARTARGVVAVGVAGTATVVGMNVASAAPSGPIDATTATSASLREATSLSAISPQRIDLGDLLGRPPYGCFVCGLGGFPPIFDDLVVQPGMPL